MGPLVEQRVLETLQGQAAWSVREPQTGVVGDCGDSRMDRIRGMTLFEVLSECCSRACQELAAGRKVGNAEEHLPRACCLEHKAECIVDELVEDGGGWGKASGWVSQTVAVGQKTKTVLYLRKDKRFYQHHFHKWWCGGRRRALQHLQCGSGF